MRGTLSTCGYPSVDELRASPGFPSDARLQRGPVAVIECVQEIPCNPCEEACPTGAITVGSPITNCPVLDPDKCKGCGACLAPCPGQAIFLVDMTLSAETAAVSFPHEYLPLPVKDDQVEVVDRAGRVVGRARVLRVSNPARYDHTAIITVQVPRRLAGQVRGMVRRKGASDRNG